MRLFFDFENGTYDQFKAILAFNEFKGDVYGVTTAANIFSIYAVDANRRYVHKYIVPNSGPMPPTFTTDFPNALLVAGSLSITF